VTTDEYDVIERTTPVPPADRLPETLFNPPPKASPYHTERAERARNWVQAALPTYLEEAQALIANAGGSRLNLKVADVFDHNASTLACAMA
jgi:hypothetical protein